MAHYLKGKVFTDKHPARGDRLLAVIWEGADFVVAFSNGNRTTRIRKSRLCNHKRYSDTGFYIDPDSDFVNKRFPTIKRALKN